MYILYNFDRLHLALDAGGERKGDPRVFFWLGTIVHGTILQKIKAAQAIHTDALPCLQSM
jgi:hypothetical protein